VSILLALGGCTLEPGSHFSTMDMDRYGTSVSGMPGAGAATSTSGAGGGRAVQGPGDTPPPGAVTEITPELIKAERLAAPTTIPADVQSLFDTPKPYTIGPGDVLSIMVWDHPELNLPAAAVQTVGIDYTGSASVASGYSVDHNGMIQFAYAGAVKVAGLTEMQARDVLTAKLGEYVRRPQITLRVQTYRSGRVYVDGEVRTPGLLIFTDVPMTLPEALNRAGGFTAVGDRASIAVIRGGKSVVVNIPDLIEKGINPARVLLRNDDMVRVYAREDSKVFLIGEVTRPVTLFLRNGELSLNEALGDASGVSQVTGDGRQVYVVRNLTADTHQIFHLNTSNPAALALAENFELKAKDVVFVDTAPVVRWARILNNVLPSAQTAYFGKAAAAY
jgi:polysaccharide export outer membrane protein